MVQKKRPMAPEQSVAVNKVVDELVSIGILRDLIFLTWVANPVIVK